MDVVSHVRLHRPTARGLSRSSFLRAVRVRAAVCWCVLLAALVMPSLGPVMAQLAVGLDFDAVSYVQFERVPAKVHIKNNTSEIFVLGGRGKTLVLDFEIYDVQKTRCERTTRGGMVKDVVLMPGETTKVEVDLGMHFGLQRLGQYSVRGRVVEGNKAYPSMLREIDVVPGIEIDTIERSVPGESSNVRVYSLRYWERDSQEHLFLRVTDRDATVCYGVFSLGKVIRFSVPTLSVDVDGNITVGHQVERDVFVRSRFRSVANGVEFVDRETKTLSDTLTDEIKRSD